MTNKNDDRKDEDERSGPTKAYKDMDFMTSRAARSLRILSEFIEPEDRFARYNISDTIVFFGSARTLSKVQGEADLVAAQKHGGDVVAAQHNLEMSKYYEDARELSGRLTTWSKGLTDSTKRFVVCTGGGPGIMEAAN
ncbi:MAG: hypothetical protein JKY92_00525, partial [Magnetovibrio sp.]|nr:hypothetical protein [Magnetovibrio sp.]